MYGARENAKLIELLSFDMHLAIRHVKVKFELNSHLSIHFSFGVDGRTGIALVRLM